MPERLFFSNPALLLSPDIDIVDSFLSDLPLIPLEPVSCPILMLVLQSGLCIAMQKLQRLVDENQVDHIVPVTHFIIIRNRIV